MVGMRVVLCVASIGAGLILTSCSSSSPEDATLANPTDRIAFAGGAGEAIADATAQRYAYLKAASGYFESVNRKWVYVAGSKALGCVITSAAPLLVSRDEFDPFRSEVDGLAATEAKVSRALADADTAKSKLRAVRPKLADLADADAQIAQAQTLLTYGQQSLTAGRSYVQQIESSGSAILEQVARVVQDVNREIASDEPNADTIGQDIRAGSRPAGGIALIPEPGNAPSARWTKSLVGGEEQPLLDDLNSKLAVLRTSSAKLLRTAAPVRSYLNAHNPMELVRSNDQCGVTSVGLVITPSQTQVALAPGQQYVISIDGGTQPYSVVIAGGQIPDGVTLTRSAFDQVPVVATVKTDKDKTKTGGFAVAISDASDSSALINFTVK